MPADRLLAALIVGALCPVAVSNKQPAYGRSEIDRIRTHWKVAGNVACSARD